MTTTIQPCLWFDTQAEEAARYYASIFKNSRVGRITHYGKEGFETHHKPAGSVLTAEFELDGQPFTALNGGPDFKFNEAMSLQVLCDTQQEIDTYWAKLSEGGDPKAQVCGWLKDKYGVSWQVIPRAISEWVGGEDEKSQRAMKAMMQMKKVDLNAIKRAYEGRAA